MKKLVQNANLKDLEIVGGKNVNCNKNSREKFNSILIKNFGSIKTTETTLFVTHLPATIDF